MSLIGVLSNQDEHVEVQRAAEIALGKLGDNGIYNVLARLAVGEESRLQAEAGRALERGSTRFYASIMVNGQTRPRKRWLPTLGKNWRRDHGCAADREPGAIR